MFNKKIFLFLTLFIILPSIHAIQMLEPIMTDVSPNKVIEIGTVAPGEYFMISFFLGVDEKYDLITTDNYGSNYLFFENTQKTKESIYTIVKIKENVSGEQQVKIILKNTETGEAQSVYIKMTVATNVISSFVLPYDKNTKFGEKKDITIRIINKSITTKKITISSNLPVTWFDSKETGKIKKESEVVLQPSDSIDVNYSFIPKAIGDKEIQLFIYTDAVPQNNIIQTTTFFTKVLFERNEEKVNIFVKKDLSALYAANLYNFPTFALNAIPAYFFNNIIRIASE
jgi:hypothetical protein